MSGKLIVFEGIDGSGKSTQFDMMCRRLETEGVNFCRLTFPQYTENSSALIKMYLGGEFGENPEDVNPYAASTFYAVDRYASYIKIWRDYYLGGGIVLADRYTTSNAIHQGSKLPVGERAGFFKWLHEFEYHYMGLPEPDAVIYMDIPLKTAIANMRLREAATEQTGDIHEIHDAYMDKCRDTGRMAADYYGWRIIRCVEGGEMRRAGEIHDEIYDDMLPM